ncbi:hypothetical protein chiPu_0029670, partial [Chiloscyllium punctatum]|nr:hypothetical protein [Chiloscyllium punctatum]
MTGILTPGFSPWPGASVGYRRTQNIFMALALLGVLACVVLLSLVAYFATTCKQSPGHRGSGGRGACRAREREREREITETYPTPRTRTVPSARVGMRSDRPLLAVRSLTRSPCPSAVSVSRCQVSETRASVVNRQQYCPSARSAERSGDNVGCVGIESSS